MFVEQAAADCRLKEAFYAPDESSSVFCWTCVFLLTPWQRRVGVCLSDGCVHRVSVALPTATNHPYAPDPSFIPPNCLSDCPEKHKAHTCVYILLFIQRKQLGSRLSLRGQRSLIMYRLKSRIIIKTVSNSEKHSWGSPRKVPLSTSWRTPIDSKEISIPTFFVRLRRELTRRNWFLQTIIVAEPRYDITGEKQDNKNRI